MQYVSTAPGKRSAARLAALEDGDGEHVLGDLAVDLEHAQRLRDGLVGRGVRGVALLPQELARAQEEARAHLPAQDVGPLVVEERQVAVALDPALVGAPDDRLGRRPDGERLLQLLAAAVGDHRDLRREALDVIGLLLEQAHRDQQREVEVLVPGRLEPVVERALQQLPDGVAVRPDDHRAPCRAVLGQLGALHDLDVPGRESPRPARAACSCSCSADASRCPGTAAGNASGGGRLPLASPVREWNDAGGSRGACWLRSQRWLDARPSTPASISVALIGFAK